ncbi:hypothetical protein DER29_3142 [Micromonospora sp. M71_S20]|jgi:hypothetical protein|uniref:hypothetical protein n=1 Tax=Micromonospora sp. M71_S20 TaxID=592872 RepID=UPI000F2BB8B7|nr:hypothetical protein [Micromonospora sp. M71_S20]RLK25156.1 hypothetical protein DER29_3142 [Micromonospora sp. M71_S20]
MSEPQETRDESERTDPIVAPPTANPARVRMPPEDVGQQGDDPEPAESDRRRREEG